MINLTIILVIEYYTMIWWVGVKQLIEKLRDNDGLFNFVSNNPISAVYLMHIFELHKISNCT